MFNTVFEQDIFTNTTSSIFDTPPVKEEKKEEEVLKRQFYIWEILSIPAFSYEGEEVVFPHQHRIVFGYLASLANKHGTARASYLSIMYRTGTDETEEVASIVKWLEHFKLVERVKYTDEKGVRTAYKVNYPGNTFPYTILPPAQQR